jgi:hypothetical protein
MPFPSLLFLSRASFLTPHQAVFAVEVSLAYLVGARYDGFTNSYMTPEARAALDPNSEEYHSRVMGSKIQVAGWNLYAMVLWLIKGSLAVFYSRLTYASPATAPTHSQNTKRTLY